MVRRVKRIPHRNGPGLLFILIALVVVAAAGARYFDLYTPERPTLGPRENVKKTGSPPTESNSTEENSTEGMNIEEPAEPVTVLVYHAHTSENYSPHPSHAKNGKGDILQIGAEFCQAISEKGIKALHLKAGFDLPEYSQAFQKAGQAVERALNENTGVKAVIDIHRDGLPKSKGDGYTTAEVAGQKVAKILFVVGDVSNPNRQTNTAFAETVKARLNAMYPNVARGIKVQHRNLNGRLHPNTLTVYVGDYHDNNLEEAKRSARILAEVVAAVLMEKAVAGMPVVPTTTP